MATSSMHLQVWARVHSATFSRRSSLSLCRSSSIASTSPTAHSKCQKQRKRQPEFLCFIKSELRLSSLLRPALLEPAVESSQDSTSLWETWKISARAFLNHSMLQGTWNAIRKCSEKFSWRPIQFKLMTTAIATLLLLQIQRMRR